VAAPAVRVVAVEEDRDGQRIDNFLLGQLKGVPRTLVYRLLRTGQVRVDGHRCKADQRLQAGQQVRIPPIREAAAGAPMAASSSLLESLQARIIAEDERTLVLDKPSGLASHGGSGISYGAIEAMRQARPQQTLELVHRLDRDTSGLLVLAKKRATLLHLQTELREGNADKRYLALLLGRMEQNKVDVNAPLRKQVLSGGERMVRVASDGKPSLSHFKVIERFGQTTLVEIRIDTGRTHQIRVHAAHIGHPVAGDDKYGDAGVNRELRAAGLERLFLHAAELRLAKPEGGHWHWRAALPESLEAVLRALRLETRAKERFNTKDTKDAKEEL
jgi:23S rRNA pseudouridine955/2504/2580 synthase